MVRRMLITTTLILIGLLATISVFAGQTMTMRIGQTKKTIGNVQVKLVEVVEDSRCPIGAECIWAGRAVLRVEVKGKNGRVQTAELEVGNAASVVTIDGIKINILSLTPHPNVDKQLSVKDYVAKITVQRNSKKS